MANKKQVARAAAEAAKKAEQAKADKRNMQVALTVKGRGLLETMNCCSIPVPELLQQIIK